MFVYLISTCFWHHFFAVLSQTTSKPSGFNQTPYRVQELGSLISNIFFPDFYSFLSSSQKFVPISELLITYNLADITAQQAWQTSLFEADILKYQQENIKI